MNNKHQHFLWSEHNCAKLPLKSQIHRLAQSIVCTGRRVIDPFRSSLSSKTIEALICFQNWLRSESIQSIEYVPTLEDMNCYEEVERDHVLQDIADSAQVKDAKWKGTKKQEAAAAMNKQGALAAPKKTMKGLKAVGSSKRPRK